MFLLTTCPKGSSEQLWPSESQAAASTSHQGLSVIFGRCSKAYWKTMHLENTHTFPTSFSSLSWGISNKISISQHDNQRCGVAFRLATLLLAQAANAWKWQESDHLTNSWKAKRTYCKKLHISTVFKHMCEYQVTLGRTSWFQPNPPIIPYYS